MHKWKRMMSAMLTSVMVLGGGLAAAPEKAAAADLKQAVPGQVYDIYKAFHDDANKNPTGELVDPEFGDQPGALNSSLSPRVLQLKHQGEDGGVGDAADNGKMYATFECNRLPKEDAQLSAERWGNGENISGSLSSFPIYESTDGGATWGGEGYTDRSARGENYVPVGYVQNQGAENGVTGMRNCPELYEMPETIGDLKKGTILCAGNSIEAGQNGNAADVAQSNTTYLDLCTSTDLGRTWAHHSSIVGPIEGQCRLLHDTVWEPFFLTFGGRLYCFYSDEALKNSGHPEDQDISYVYYDGTKWSEKHQVIYTSGSSRASVRPGMPVVSQLEDGRFMLTYEMNGGSASGYILSAKNDPTVWYTKDGAAKDTKNGEYAAHSDGVRINNSGSPYNITASTGAVVYNNNALGQIWVNSSKSPDEKGAFWRYYNTGLGGAYNRQIQQLDNGNLFITAGWNDSGIKCVTLDYTLDPEKTGALESKVKYNGSPVYMAYNNTPMFTWSGVDGHAEPNQYYEFREVENGIYMMVSTNNGKAVTAESGNEGSKVNTSNVNKKDKKQQWTFEKVEGEEDFYKVRNVSSDLYLTTPRTNESAQRDLRLTLEAARDTESQLWSPGIKITESNKPDPAEKYNVRLIPSDGVELNSDTAKVEAGGTVEITITPRQGCRSIDRILINNEEQSFTPNADGTVSLTVENIGKDIEVSVETTLDDWYVSVPTNDYPGRNQCLSPRIVEGLNGELYCTFENGVPSAAADGEYTFPVYKSENKGKNWTKAGEVINDDTVHPDVYYKVSYNGDVPASAVKADKEDEGAVLHTWNMQNCPQLFVLPEDFGSLRKGTLICAGVAVPLEKGAKKVADAGYGGLWDSSLDMYYSEDGGATWKYFNNIATGGENPRNIMGYDPVWEPFFVFYDRKLICYYSDETDNTYKGSQKLVHKILEENQTEWSELTVDVEHGAARPGMPIVTQLKNGQWMMVYEGVGMSNPIKTFYKIADNPYDWNPANDGKILPGINGTYGGSPYVYTLKDGRIVAGTGSLSEVFINTKEDGTGAWISYTTDAPAGYNRCYLQLSTGEFLICGTEGPGFAGKNNSIFVRSLNVDDVFQPSEALNTSQNIQNKANQEAIGVWQGSKDDGAKAVTWELKKDAADQMWIPQYQDDGSYLLKNYNSDMVLTVKEDGTLMQSAQITDGSDAIEAQRFIIENAGSDGYCTIKSRQNGKYLSTSNAANELILSDTGVADAQMWSFLKVSDGGTDFVPEEKKEYTITAFSSKGGSIDPSGSVIAEEGMDQEFTFTPQETYSLADVTVDGVSVFDQVVYDQQTGTGTYTISHVIQDMEIRAEFAKIPQLFAVSIDENMEHGTIAADKTEAAEGDIVTLAIRPEEGWQLKAGSLLVNGEPLEGTGFEMPAADVLITAEFEEVNPEVLRYDILVQNMENGSVIADKNQAEEGETVTLSIIPADGYQLKEGSLTVNGETIEGTSFIMPAAEAVVAAEFEEIPAAETLLTDEITGISVTGYLPDGCILKVEKVEEGEDYENIAAFITENVKDVPFRLFSIRLVIGDEEVQLDGTLMVSIPVPEKFGDKLGLYRQEKDGKMTKLAFEMKDGAIVFGTEHLSYYAIADLDAQQTGGDDQKPGGDDQKPGGDDQKPGGDNEQPGGDDQKPGGNNEQPGGSDQKPGNKPSTGGQNQQGGAAGKQTDSKSAIKSVKTGDSLEITYAAVLLIIAVFAGTGAVVYRKRYRKNN